MAKKNNIFEKRRKYVNKRVSELLKGKKKGKRYVIKIFKLAWKEAKAKYK